MRKVIALLLLMLVFGVGCVERGTVKGGGLSNSIGVASGEDAFSLALYKELSKSDGNVFFSPYSIHTALAMLYEGAGGKTAEEMERVLHLPSNSPVRQEGFRKLITALNPRNGPYALRTANALWIQREYRVRKTYIDTVKNYYLGEVHFLDFRGNPFKAAGEINGWVGRQTGGKIRNIVSPGMVEAAKLVLTNAIYFKGEWERKFDPRLTENETFHTPHGNVTVEMMHDAGVYNYTELNGTQVLELPYKGGRLSMLVFLPKGVGGYKGLDSKLTVDYILSALKSMKPENVSVSMPKFEFRAEYRLSDVLKAMGMGSAFTREADFSGIGDGGLYISEVVHKAYIKVAENGTEAAAATAAIVLTSAHVIGELPQYIEFRADHPFVFVIMDKDTKEILFIGRLVNPGE
ncbi:serpin family protein [Thermococcus sp.]